MLIKKTLKNYVSPIDLKLKEFDSTQPKSPSQLAEIQKYQRIHQLRDQELKEKTDSSEDLWEGF